MTCNDKQHVKLAEFMAEHEWTLRAALGAYVERMSGHAGEFQAAYDAIKDNPDKRAAQDGTIMTTNGLLQSAAMFREQAAKAAKARAAFEALDEEDNDEASWR